LVLAALDPGGRGRVIGDGEAAPRLVARHGPPGAVAAALEGVLVSQAAHDVGPRAHAARDDAEIARARAHGPLARHEDVGAEVALARAVVVVAVHRLEARLDRRQEAAASQ